MARKLQEAERMREELQEQLETTKKAENDLESALTHCHGKIDELVSKHVEAREKVSESLHLVECAVAENEAAVLRERQTRGKSAICQQGIKCQCSL
jgi:predicted  nucleic acid-binding Zn-ribbon protein